MYNPNSPANMGAALTKAAQRGYPGLAGSTGFPKSGPGKNTPQFKPVGAKQGKNTGKPGKMTSKPAKGYAKKAKIFSATKFNNQKAKTFNI